MFILYILSMLGTIICAFLNPYVNLFGIFPGIMFFVMLIFYIIGVYHLNKSRKFSDNQYKYVKAGRTCLMVFIVICVVMFILNTGISIAVTLLRQNSFGEIKTNLSFDILNIKDDPGLCKCVLFMQFFCNSMAVITAVIQRKYVIIKLLSLYPANLQQKERISNL